MGGATEREGFQKRVLVSYDIDAGNARLRAKISRLVFGGTVTRRWNGHVRRYRYDGILAHPDAKYVGQSVVLLPPDQARNLVRKLEALRVKVEATEVYLPP